MSFNVEHPFTTNNILRGARWHEIPCTISKKCYNFIRHGLPPFNIFDGLGNANGFNRFKKRVGCIGLVDTWALKILFLDLVVMG